ncbi:phage replisome organizer N-terminal domain-containing protein [Virgibacillus oceani]
MSDVKWIKLSTQMFEDEKIRLIEQMPEADTILIIWVKLLAQAGRTNASGYIYLSENIPYTDEMLATIFNRPISTVRLALETFRSFGMIEIDEDLFISISNWSKHQSIDKLAEMREKNRVRQAKYRENKKLEEPKQGSNVTVTSRNETELELELEEELDKKEKKNKYIRDLFDHYLSKNIIRHQKLTSPMKTAISARLKDYSFEELKQAIDNYSVVYKSDVHWFTHKYPLADFMRDKDVRKFLNEADPLNNFLIRSKQPKKAMGQNYDPGKDRF